MKAEQLRVGNIVILNGLRKEEDIIVQEIRKTGVRHNDNPYTTPFEILKPMPLTEEWLIKFGFWRKPPFGMGKSIGKHDSRIELEWLPIDQCYQLEYFGIRYISDILIKHVHQLQNLYYALTGKELALASTKTETT